MDKEKLIRNDLIEQMEEKEVDNEYYTDLIDDYIKCYRMKNKLAEDIEDRGVSIKWQNSENSYGFKKNDSIPEFVRVSSHMIKILKDLGLQPSEHEEEPEIPDEM
jgi:phage terminase small subunit